MKYHYLDLRHLLYKNMGGEQSINYCTPVTQKPEGESAIYRNPFTKDKLYDRPEEGVGTMKAAILSSAKRYANRPALGIALFMQEKSLKRRTSRRLNLLHIHKLLKKPIKLVAVLSMKNSLASLKVKKLDYWLSSQRTESSGV